MKDAELDADLEDREYKIQLAKFQSEMLANVSRESEPALQQLARKGYDTMYSRKKIKMLADLNINQIRNIFKLLLMNKAFFQRYANPDHELYNFFDAQIKDLLSLTVSKSRLGREEGVKLTTSLTQQAQEELMKNQFR